MWQIKDHLAIHAMTALYQNKEMTLKEVLFYRLGTGAVMSPHPPWSQLSDL